MEWTKNTIDYQKTEIGILGTCDESKEFFFEDKEFEETEMWEDEKYPDWRTWESGLNVAAQSYLERYLT